MEEDKIEASNPEKRDKKNSGKWLKSNWLLVVLCVVIILLGGYIAYGAYGSAKKTNSVQSSATATGTPTTSVVSSKTDRIVDEGVTWIDPVELPDLGLFIKNSKSEEMNEYLGTSYYKVGYISSGKDIILAKVKIGSMGDFYRYERFLKSGESYSRIGKNSEDIEEGMPFDGSGYSEDSTTVFKSILPDESIITGKTKLALEAGATRSVSIADDTGNDTKIGSTKWGDLFYRVVADGIKDSNGNTSDQVVAARYYIKLNDSTKVVFSPTGTFVRDDNTFDLEFTTTTQKADSYKFEKLRTGGCGLGLGSFPVLTDDTEISGKKLLGKNGVANVYYVDDVNSDTVKFGYEMYKMGRDESVKSIQEFADSYGVVFWKDAYGSTIVYMNSDWAPQTECGKPVVYLYPEKEMQVSVEVGAKITKSEPDYGYGWTVTAYPNGRLSNSSGTYPYLFWEGLGFGNYPAINSGTVVKRTDVQMTIETQLSQIGLTSKEISDFEEFWLPKMPNKPYIRLTWLQNEEMNELAPLRISPAPKSLIRAFLDFQGYDNKIDLPAQKLISYKRDGFTAVEWGGLLVK